MIDATVLPVPFTCTSSGPAWLLHFIEKVQRCEFTRITMRRERKAADCVRSSDVQLGKLTVD